jgi:hypothetical protein
MSKFAQTQAKPAAAKKTTVQQPKPRARTTKVEVEPETVEVVGPEDEIHSAYQRVRDAAEQLFARLRQPSWLRMLVNTTVGLVVYASAWYGCMALVDMLMMGVIAYTGIGFISFLIAFFAVFVSFMAAFKAGKLAYEAAAAFDYERVKSRVVGWFSFGKPAPVAR